MNNLTELSLSQLKKAVAIKEQIAALESELSSLLGTPNAQSARPSAVAQRKGGMSAAGRAAVAAAQKRRWAKIKGQTATKAAAPKSAPAAKPAKKWKLSAAGLAKIKAANKAYWAKKKAAKQ